jgi:carboxypeptidase Taq
VTAHPKYDSLTATFLRIYRLEHVQAITSWDHETFMPPGGAEARGAALGELAALIHRMRTAPELAEWLAAAKTEPLGDDERANVREMQRTWRNANALPEQLVIESTLAASRCEHAWRTQRAANDWASFAPNLREVVRLVRTQATLLAEQTGTSKYDALLDRFEPGMTSAQVDGLFGALRGWLPDLIRRVRARQASQQVIEPSGPFPVERQRALCERIMKLLQFDFEGGRLDVSAHPFTGGVPEDVRMTTRYTEAAFERSLMGTIHETGHGRYEQNRPRAWLGQPISEPRSMAIHESQSLSYEMQLGRSRAFVALLAPLLAEYLGAQPAFEEENLFSLFTRVRPDFIRVDADEVTYPAHIILRYEIESALVEGALEVDDVPAAWDEKMQQLLGIDTRGNYKDGPMQDVHWPAMLFGYFPCYTLGAMYAAQWFATIRRERPALDDEIRRGELSGVFDWMRDHVWRHASRYETDELTRRATGGPLDPEHLRRHLEARYL